VNRWNWQRRKRNSRRRRCYSQQGGAGHEKGSTRKEGVGLRFGAGERDRGAALGIDLESTVVAVIGTNSDSDRTAGRITDGETSEGERSIFNTALSGESETRNRLIQENLIRTCVGNGGDIKEAVVIKITGSGIAE
jgi:hypothetical protein